MSTGLLNALCTQYQNALDDLRALSRWDDGTPEHGKAHNAALSRCKALRQKIEEVMREGKDEAKA